MTLGGRSWLKSYLWQLAIAWPGLLLGIYVTGALLYLTPLRPALYAVTRGPFFALFWVVGAFAGYRLNLRDRPRAAYWVWLPALALLAWDAKVTFAMPVDGGWAGVWTAYLSNNRSASECLGEFFETVPLITCISYSLGAWWARRRGPATSQSSAQPSPDGSHV